MPGCPAGCIGCANRFSETLHRRTQHIPVPCIISGKAHLKWTPNSNPYERIDSGRSEVVSSRSLYLSLETLVKLVIANRLSLRWFDRRSILEHHRDAILHRVVAPTTRAMQPRRRGILRACRDGIVAHGANKDREQSLGENRAGHVLSLDRSV
jgi:hypothetical protein